LAEAGCVVTAIDRDSDALAYAREHYSHERVTFSQESADRISIASDFDAAVCFETIEHIEDPRPMLRELARVSPRLIASVPNEFGFPWKGHAFHFRHYTPKEFEALLAECGWRVLELHSQAGPTSEVERHVAHGRTAIAIAERCEPQVQVERAKTVEKVPDHVTILGLGPSLEHFVDHVKRMGSRRRFAGEIWGINQVADVIQCDRVFHMDDVLVQEARAAAHPKGNIAAMLEWMKDHQRPVYTSLVSSDGRDRSAYPTLVEFPLQDVINNLGYCYFNSTAAFAVAYAVHLGVKKISLFGIDFTYANTHHAEKGRACVEFWLGFAAARGITIGLSDRTSLMDAVEPRVYGYDAVDVHIAEQSNGMARVILTPVDLPSAEEVEHRYDHSRHPNPLVK
jgi:hypothetical protein